MIITGVDYTHSNFGGPGTETAFETARRPDQPANPALFPNAPRSPAGSAWSETTMTPIPIPGTTSPTLTPTRTRWTAAVMAPHVAGSAAGYGVKADGSTYDGVYDNSTDFAAIEDRSGHGARAKVTRSRSSAATAAPTW